MPLDKPLSAAVVLLRWAWWLALAYLPVRLSEVRRDIGADLGCPVKGDCYVPGSASLFDLDLAVTASAILIWPVAAYFVVYKPLVRLASRR